MKPRLRAMTICFLSLKSDRVTGLPFKSARVKSGAGVLRLMVDMRFAPYYCYFLNDTTKVNYIIQVSLFTL